MSCCDVLPFPRGGTACGGVITPAAGQFKHLVGREYTVNDTQNGTGSQVTLRVVEAEAEITAARAFYAYDDDALDFGTQLTGSVVGAQGGFGVALDDAYVVGQKIPANDCCYVVVKGLVKVVREANTTSIAAGQAIVSSNAGLVSATAPAAGNAVLGRNAGAANTTSGATMTIYVDSSTVGGEGT